MAQRGTMAWIWQAFTGLLLIVLLGLHLIVQHFVSGGLMGYQDIVRYLSNPYLLLLEILFLAAVIFHALSGVRALVIDGGVSQRTVSAVTWALVVLGLLMFGYGVWLFTVIL